MQTFLATRQEAAADLRIKERRLDELRRAGKIPYVQFGQRLFRYNLAWLRHAIEEHPEVFK